MHDAPRPPPCITASYAARPAARELSLTWLTRQLAEISHPT